MTVAEPTYRAEWPCVALGSNIECAPAVLQAICMAAAAGLRKLTKGGLEVGGVLFGERANGVTRILATRPITCEHRFGPSFILSEMDRAGLETILAESKSDAELRSLESLGCYFSHSRHGATLTDSDVELCQQYFAQAHQLAVLLIPSANGIVRGTLFARDTRGALTPCHEFEHSVIRKPPRAARPEIPRLGSLLVSRPKAPVKERGEITTAAPITPVPQAPQAQFKVKPTSAPASYPNGLNLRTSLLAGFLILLLCWPNRAIPVTQIPLSFTDNGEGELIIRWDATRPAVRTAVLGRLDIRDGEQKPLHVSIGPDLLLRGWIPYHRKSDLVRISFTLASPGLTISDNAIYFAPQRKITTPAPVEVKALGEEIPEVKTTAPEPAVTTVVATDSIVSSVPIANEKSPRKPDAGKPPRVFRAPVEPPARPAAPASLRQAILPDPPAIRFEGAAPSTPPLNNLTVTFSAPRPVKAVSTSGRLIWTGQLPKRSMLALSAQGASVGYLNGWLPAGPLHIEVHPGELIEGGMLIFTKDASSHSESPSPSNGWNTLMYKLDAARASELEVLEAPGPANAWSHIILRNGARSLSVLVVDWRTEQN